MRRSVFNRQISTKLSSRQRGSALGANHRTRQLTVQLLEPRLALTALPAGFTEQLVTTNSDLSSPTAMEFSPTGQLFALEQGGLAKQILSTGASFTSLTLAVNSVGERGLLGITFDPSYDGAGPNVDYVYLYYTSASTGGGDPQNNRLSRFTASADSMGRVSFGSELILRDLPPEAEDGDSNHNGGAVHFGPDGKLYLAVGDHNYDNVGQENHVAQILTTPFGKMLRLNSDGTNPTDNPYYDGSATDWQGAIWARGLRNPFTFAFQPGTGKMFINDVGENQWEEINLGVAGANYGWSGSNPPIWEGFESSGPPWATNYRNPEMAYDHSSGAPTPAGVDITGGAFYPANSQFGSFYAGKYFYSDAGAGFIRVFDPANPGSMETVANPQAPDTSTDFATLTNGGAVDLKLDAAGSLYYLARGGTGEIYRISSTKVYARQLFYNQSKYDGNSAAINSLDDAAIATDKSALLPGAGAATQANVSSYSKGINGVMIDIAGNHGSITAADFTFRVGNNNSPSGWSTAPAPSAVSVRVGAGVSGSDRVEIIWADNAIQKRWLEVITKANANTGLAQTAGLPTGQADVFFFGNAIGDTGVGNTATNAVVNAFDQAAVRANGQILANNIPLTNSYDFNRDGSVNAADESIARLNATNLTTVVKYLNIGNLPAAPQADDGGDSGLTSALTATGANASEPVDQLPAVPRISLPKDDAALDSRSLAWIYERLAQAATSSRDRLGLAGRAEIGLEAEQDEEWIEGLLAH
jgi:glucose/arabinose dehydrogenase